MLKMETAVKSIGPEVFIATDMELFVGLYL